MPTHFDPDAESAKLDALRLKEEEDLAEVLSGKYGMQYADLSVIAISNEALRLVPEEKAREAEVIPFAHVAKKVSIAVHNPNNPALPAVLESLEERGFVLTKYMVSAQSFRRALERYKDLSFAHVTAAGVFDLTNEDMEKLTAELHTLSGLKTYLDTVLASRQAAQVSRILEDIVVAALSMKASDIHVEPEEHAVRLRLRIDGLLEDAYMFDAKTYRSLNSRVKLLSGLKLNVENRAQDGRFTIAVGGKEIEIRTSAIPGNYGEALVLRILDPSALGRTFEAMGMHPKLLAKLREEIRRPNGMLLTTGPTGSGKTTTLYTFLRELHTPETKIVTIEDPIEYHLEGIVQTQVDHKSYTFASGLRSVLRQDPDVILVGEIRDKEVAETAIQAALTGHFVFSTLHTNNAAGTFPRLVDLGADPKVFASSVTVAMAQRLIRTLDPEHRVARATTPEEKALMEKVFATLEDKSLIPASFDTAYDAVPYEGGSGYKGRAGVYEGIFMDEELGTFLRDNPSEGDIQKHVRRQGFPDMAQVALMKVLAGETSMEEVKRVVDLPS